MPTLGTLAFDNVFSLSQRSNMLVVMDIMYKDHTSDFSRSRLSLASGRSRLLSDDFREPFSMLSVVRVLDEL